MLNGTIININGILSNHLTPSFSHWVQKSVLYMYVETYTLPHVKSIASGSFIYDAEHPEPCSVTTWRDGVRRKVGASGWGDTCMSMPDSY